MKKLKRYSLEELVNMSSEELEYIRKQQKDNAICTTESFLETLERLNSTASGSEEPCIYSMEFLRET